MARREVYWSYFNQNVPLRTLRDDKPESFMQALMENREDEWADGEDSLAVREAVAEAFEALDDRDKFILNARLFERLSVREIGSMLSVSHVHVLRLSNRALQQLTDTLSQNWLIRKRVGMDPATWDEAAYRQVKRYEQFCKDVETKWSPGAATAHLRTLRDKAWIQVSTGLRRDLLRTIDAMAYTAGDLLSDEAWDSLPSLLVYKQRRYGCDNILRFGFQGIVIRMSDKVERLVVQEARGDIDDEDPAVDLIGYAVIAHMVDDETFTLPLMEDQS